MLAVITCCERTIWPSASQLGAAIRRRIVIPRHLDLADMELRDTDHISHSYFIMSFSDQTKTKWKKKVKTLFGFPKGAPAEQAFCNCLATAGYVCVEVQSSETHSISFREVESLRVAK